MSAEPMTDAEVAPGSARVRLAELARAAALGVPGVAEVNPGPTGLFVTVDRSHRVEGVQCIAAGADVYEVSLCLCCELVPLPRAGDAVRASVLRAALRAGIAVDEVNVLIADVIEPERAR